MHPLCVCVCVRFPVKSSSSEAGVDSNTHTHAVTHRKSPPLHSLTHTLACSYSFPNTHTPSYYSIKHPNYKCVCAIRAKKE